MKNNKFLNYIEKKRVIIILSFISIVISLSFRVLSIENIIRDIIDGKYIWAEDGNIFFQQSLEGLFSIFKLYAGYLHIYPRIVALIANLFDFSLLPIIYFIFSLVPLVILPIYFYKFYNQSKVDNVNIILITILLIIIPISSIIFFNLTNVQWFLAIILFLIIFIDGYKLNLLNIIWLIILSLTGPFSFFYIPIIIIYVFIRNNFLKIKDYSLNDIIKLCIIIICGLLQGYFLLSHPRSLYSEIDKNFYSWLKNLYIFFGFGSNSLFSILGISIWIIVFFIVIMKILNYSRKKIEINTREIISLIILLSSIICYIPSLYSCKNVISVIHPQGAGERYFFLPYSFLIISIPLLTDSIKIKTYLFMALFIISINRFTIINKSNLYFQSWAWYKDYVEECYIPIHPQWEMFPGWHIYIKNKQVKLGKKINIINDKNLTIDYSNKVINYKLPFFLMGIKNFGIEISMFQEKSCWVFFKGFDDLGEEVIEMKRYYKSGNSTVQFAFPNKDLKNLKFQIDNNSNKIKIYNINIYYD